MQYLLLLLVTLANGEHFKTNMMDNRTTIVHLFEWKWKDIAEECERFLAPEGFGGVQISPPSENLIIHIGDGKRTWYERYQVMSYKLETRSGNEDDFLNMTTRCNNVGVRTLSMLDIVPRQVTQYWASTFRDMVKFGVVWLSARCKAKLAAMKLIVIKRAREYFPPDQMLTLYKAVLIFKELVLCHRLLEFVYMCFFNRIFLGDCSKKLFEQQESFCTCCGRIYADVVVNHMTGSHKDNVGTGGSRADFNKCSYPAVPYTEEHFHPFCIINNYFNATEVRNCQLLGLKDLNQTEVYVRNRIVSYVNKLIKFGVAGVRIDAAKHMWPSDLREIYTRFDNLNPQFRFPRKSRPYIYQEVIYHGGEPIRPEEYTPLGDVTEFRVGSELKNVFRGHNNMKWLVNWGEQWGLSSGNTALVFIDNHDTQRSSDVLTYKEAKAYKAAIAFILAHPYGKPRIMSSYAFTTIDQGPPDDGHENILSPIINQDDTCGNGWVCEHRWRQIYQMVGFRNAVINTNLQNWWDNGYKQIAFGRGGKGFIVFNGDSVELNKSLQTGLPAGEYCDIISGSRVGSFCTGKKISVNNKGNAHFFISPHAEDMHIAIHIGEESKTETKKTGSVPENLKTMSVISL